MDGGLVLLVGQHPALPKPGGALQMVLQVPGVFAVGQTHSNGCCHHLHLKGSPSGFLPPLGGSLSSASVSAPGSSQITASVQFSSVQSLGRVRLLRSHCLCARTQSYKICVHLKSGVCFLQSSGSPLGKPHWPSKPDILRAHFPQFRLNWGAQCGT